MNANDIILKPVISEKTTELMGINKYVFRVSMKANKLMVAHAVKELFGVDPEKVNVMTVRGKNRRLRYRVGKRSAWKKAVITLKPGQKIELFEAQ
ncbi:MAG TPA: 50S ribosomal protein L23 [Spirochaetota bacterium]|jgi:large subunit ribosomal protein L23|nr:50S ribosomal protein L23 [Spirochaetota bacterium]HOD13491.1 50S ribosomal protein L23 [Spirochaetota bacterium]HPG49845.1 50S ribosomal protein L23 [Spirochaetota bacterium]HPN13810.1 50S ribosomal protein L23 [Spirochaetota bacterium]HQL80618.1 50S ribosomal protein L23 [Spirochaetota bacterium]